jgi:carboxyl-terminal processing protease
LLLRKAIEQITGIPSGVRIQQLNRQELGSSLDAKSRSGLLIESLSEN